MAKELKAEIKNGKEIVSVLGQEYNVSKKDSLTVFGNTYRIKHIRKKTAKKQKTEEVGIDTFIEAPEEN